MTEIKSGQIKPFHLDVAAIRNSAKNLADDAVTVGYQGDRAAPAAP